MRGLIASVLIAAAGSVLAQERDITVTPIDKPFDFERTDNGGLLLRQFEPGERREGFDELYGDEASGPNFDFEAERRSETVATEDAPGAILRGLDKVTGEVTEMRLAAGDRARLGRLEITLAACRRPQANPTGDAFAWVEVVSDGRDAPEFSGWMVASSPALSALDHARYDVWVIRCTST